jgi:DNA modification methylase
MTKKAPIVWQNITAPLSSVRPWDHNPKQITRERAERLLRLWDELGQFQTIAVGPDFELYDGHQRYSVLKAAGRLELPVDMRQSSRALTTKERKRLVVESHATATGSFDWDMLANEFDPKELEDFGLGKSIAGQWASDIANLRALVASEGGKTEKQDDADLDDRADELLDVWKVKSGDLWRLGDHALLCGDSRDHKVAQRVMGEDLVDLFFTSPPYLDQRVYTKEAASSLLDWSSLMARVVSAAPMADDAQLIVNLGIVHKGSEWLPYWDEWIETLRASGWRRFGLYVWDQGAGLPGDWAGRLAPCFELVFHFNKIKKRPSKWVEASTAGEISLKRTFRHSDGRTKPFSIVAPVGDKKIPDSVIRVNRQIGGVGHPAPFSVDFAASIVRTWPGIVFDPFSGSGSTLIACERLGRKCRAIEISPAYVALTLERWKLETGRDPKRLS